MKAASGSSTTCRTATACRYARNWPRKWQKPGPMPPSRKRPQKATNATNVPFATQFEKIVPLCEELFLLWRKTRISTLTPINAISKSRSKTASRPLRSRDDLAYLQEAPGFGTGRRRPGVHPAHRRTAGRAGRRAKALRRASFYSARDDRRRGARSHSTPPSGTASSAVRSIRAAGSWAVQRPSAHALTPGSVIWPGIASRSCWRR